MKATTFLVPVGFIIVPLASALPVARSTFVDNSIPSGTLPPITNVVAVDGSNLLVPVIADGSDAALLKRSLIDSDTSYYDFPFEKPGKLPKTKDRFLSGGSAPKSDTRPTPMGPHHDSSGDWVDGNGNGKQAGRAEKRSEFQIHHYNVFDEDFLENDIPTAEGLLAKRNDGAAADAPERQEAGHEFEPFPMKDWKSDGLKMKRNPTGPVSCNEDGLRYDIPETEQGPCPNAPTWNEQTQHFDIHKAHKPPPARRGNTLIPVSNEYGLHYLTPGGEELLA